MALIRCATVPAQKAAENLTAVDAELKDMQTLRDDCERVDSLRAIVQKCDAAIEENQRAIAAHGERV